MAPGHLSDELLQFANITGIGPRKQEFADSRVKLRRIPIGMHLSEKTVRQWKDIFHPLPEGRHTNGPARNSIIEIASEMRFALYGGKVTIGG
jgi:hypothetical protein